MAEEDRIVEKAHVQGETQAEFVGRSVVHLFARPLVPALDVILDSERIPNRQSTGPEGSRTVDRPTPGTQRSCCRVLSCWECLDRVDRAFDGPHSAFESKFDMIVDVFPRQHRWLRMRTQGGITSTVSEITTPINIASQDN